MRKEAIHHPSQETGQHKEKSPRVTVCGFYGKILDVLITSNEKKPIMYKLALGNDDGEGKTHWKTVVSAEPHVVRFLENNIDDLHPRHTRLTAECYQQERTDHKGHKRLEYYAVNLKYLEGKK